MPMKIALDVRYRVDSGASTYIRSLVPHLVTCAGDGDRFVYVQYADQSLDGLPDAPTIRAPSGSALRDLLWTNRQLPRELRDREIDLYHGLKLFGPLSAAVPMVHTVHSITKPRGGEFPMSLRQRAIHGYGNALFKRSARVIGVSGYVSEFLTEDLGISVDRVRTIHLGVPDAFRDAMARADPSEFDTPGLGDAPYIVCVGNVEYVKNHCAVVEALAGLRDRIPHHLVIAGRADKAAASDLRSLIGSRGLADRVHLAGFLDLRQLASCLARATLQVHPSLSEGFCLAALEGMHAGLPIIATDVPGIRDVIGDTGVRIASPHDHVALATAILRWISNPEEAREHAGRGRARADRYTWERAAQRTLEVYRECLGG
jgi:glycosyltransferase involved in cell wall biosynthesis